MFYTLTDILYKHGDFFQLEIVKSTYSLFQKTIYIFFLIKKSKTLFTFHCVGVKCKPQIIFFGVPMYIICIM